MSRRRARRVAALLAAAALIAAACTDNATPEPRPTQVAQDPLPIYRAIAEQVVAIRGLEAPERADPQVIDADQLAENFREEFDESNSEDQILLGERVYKALGLFPEDESLRDVYLELQGSQIIGYYDPSVAELFIVNRSCTLGAACELGPTERVTYAHEFTHELQDQHFDLESLGLEESVDEGDRGLAVLGLVEGDAVSAQTTWMTEHLTATDLARVAAEASDPGMLAILARTPAILLETSLFPYQAGAAFVGTLLGQGGYDAVNAAFDDLPVSTEQILHPERYAAGEVPVDVEIPDDLAERLGSGWTVDAQDTLGELQLRVWLREGGALGDVAREAADGWGGDRIALLGGPGDAPDVVILVTEWDTFDDAAEFAAAAEDAVPGLGLEATVSAVPFGRRVVVGIGRDAPASLRAIVVDLAGGIEG